MMKHLFVALFFLLLVTSVYAAEDDFQKLITTGEEILILQGKLYFDYPTTILEDDLFLVEILFYPEYGSGVFTLYRDGVPLLPESTGPDVGEENAYFYLSWADSLRSNANYRLAYVSNNTVAMEKKFSVVVTPKPIASQTEQEPEILSLEKLSDDILDDTRNLLIENDMPALTLQEIKNFQSTAEKLTTFTKLRTYQQTTYEDGTTRDETIIILRIVPEELITSLDVIEHIPKNFASRATYLQTDTPFTTLQDDPVIMWHLEDVTQPIELIYTIDKTTEVTGNTVLLAQTTDNPKHPDINWRLVAPLLIIPLVALFILYFEKFSPKKK